MTSNVPNPKGKGLSLEPVKLNRRKVFAGLGKTAFQFVVAVVLIKGICQFMGVSPTFLLGLAGSIMLIKFMMVIILSAEGPDPAGAAENVAT